MSHLQHCSGTALDTMTLPDHPTSPPHRGRPLTRDRQSCANRSPSRSMSRDSSESYHPSAASRDVSPSPTTKSPSPRPGTQAAKNIPHKSPKKPGPKPQKRARSVATSVDSDDEGEPVSQPKQRRGKGKQKPLPSLEEGGADCEPDARKRFNWDDPHYRPHIFHMSLHYQEWWAAPSSEKQAVVQAIAGLAWDVYCKDKPGQHLKRAEFLKVCGRVNYQSLSYTCTESVSVVSKYLQTESSRLRPYCEVPRMDGRGTSH